MREFKKRRSPRATFLHFGIGVGALALIVLVTFLVARGAWGMYSKFSEASTSDDIAQQELQTLKAQEAQVSATVSQLSSPRGEEAQIRERYGVAKPGEGEIEIVRDASSSQVQVNSSQNWFMRLWSALFGWL